MNRFVKTAAALVAKQSIFHSDVAVTAALTRLLQAKGRVRVVSFINAHAVMRATRDNGFFDALMASEIVFRDGVGMAMLMRRSGRAPGLNLHGTGLIPKLLEQLPRNAGIALLGTREPRLGLAADRLRAMGFKQIITADGFRPDRNYIELVCKEAPKLVILAMGMPKQERVSMLLAATDALKGHDMVVVNGGAILDFLSGTVRRAPKWMRRTGLEWLFRLLREPVRMLPRFRDSLAFAMHSKKHTQALRRALDKEKTHSK